MEFTRTYDAGCCINQGAIPVGWRIVVFGWEIRLAPVARRPDCGEHGDIAQLVRARAS